jgi:hypothetical protein
MAIKGYIDVVTSIGLENTKGNVLEITLQVPKVPK